MKIYKRWILKTFSLSFIFIFGIIFTNYFIDPFQFYRKANYVPILSKEQRMQNPGVARNYKYDTIILGTSVTENFSLPQIKQAWACVPIKLSISGGTLREQSLIGNIALKTGNVKKVLWGIDFTSAAGKYDRVRDDGMYYFPHYLYDEDKINKIYYLFNATTTKQTLKALVNIIENKNTNINEFNSLDTLNNWQKEYVFAKEQVIKDYKKNTILQKKRQETFTTENFKKSLSINVIDIIKRNPNVEFILFFPPYSILFYKSFGTEIINNWLYTKIWLYNELKSLANVKIYDFQDNYDISTNLNNYKDMMHYSEDINKYMIDSISRQNYLVKSISDYEQSLSVFCKIINSYSIYD